MKEGAYAWKFVKIVPGGKVKHPPVKNYRFMERYYVYFEDQIGNQLSISVNKDDVTGEYDVDRFHFSSDEYQSDPWKKGNR